MNAEPHTTLSSILYICKIFIKKIIEFNTQVIHVTHFPYVHVQQCLRKHKKCVSPNENKTKRNVIKKQTLVRETDIKFMKASTSKRSMFSILSFLLVYVWLFILFAIKLCFTVSAKKRKMMKYHSPSHRSSFYKKRFLSVVSPFKGKKVFLFLFCVYVKYTNTKLRP